MIRIVPGRSSLPIFSGAAGGNPQAAGGAVTQGFVLIAVLLAIETAMTVRPISEAYRDRWWLRLAGVQTLCWIVLLFGSLTGQQFIYFDF